MNLRFKDYGIENPGSWDYGYRFWLSQHFTDEKGKEKATIVLTSNDLTDILSKVKELTQTESIQFIANESVQDLKEFQFSDDPYFKQKSNFKVREELLNIITPLLG